MSTTSFPYQLREACLNPGAWPTGWARLRIFGNGVGYFNQLYENNVDEVRQCFINLRDAGKELSFGVNPLDHNGWPTGAQGWDAHVFILPRLVDLAHSVGYDLEYIELDEPLTHNKVAFSDSYIAAETADFVRIARQTYPGLPFCWTKLTLIMIINA
jgi:hypothetical protein